MHVLYVQACAYMNRNVHALVCLCLCISMFMSLRVYFSYVARLGKCLEQLSWNWTISSYNYNPGEFCLNQKFTQSAKESQSERHQCDVVVWYINIFFVLFVLNSWSSSPFWSHRLVYSTVNDFCPFSFFFFSFIPFKKKILGIIWK